MIVQMNVKRLSNIALAMNIALVSFNCNAEQPDNTHKNQYAITFTEFSIEKEDNSEDGKSEYLFYVSDPNQDTYICIPSDCKPKEFANQGDTIHLNVKVSGFAANDYVSLMILEADRKWNVLSQTPDSSEIELDICFPRGNKRKFPKDCLRIPVQYLLDNHSCLKMTTKSEKDEICLSYQIDAIEPSQNIPRTDTMDGSVVAEVKFPSMIKYNVLRGGRMIGSAYLNFDSSRDLYNGKFYLTLSNFTGLGIQSNQSLHTHVDPEDFSLYGASLCDEKKCTPTNWEYKIWIKNGWDVGFSSKTTFYVYQKRSDDGTMETMLSSKAKVVDLLSAFLVTTEAVHHAETGNQKINLFVGNSTKLLDLLISKSEEHVTLSSSGKKVKVKAVSIGRYGKVTFKFYIYKDRRENVSFPVQVDMNVERGLTLKAVNWSSSK